MQTDPCNSGANISSMHTHTHTHISHNTHMQFNKIEDKSADNIAYGLSRISDVNENNTYAHTIHMQFNEIGEKGAEYIANGLAHCTGLADLSIYNNQIADGGVRSLCSALAVPTLYRYA